MLESHSFIHWITGDCGSVVPCVYRHSITANFEQIFTKGGKGRTGVVVDQQKEEYINAESIPSPGG
jgi:hypothetical protein